MFGEPTTIIHPNKYLKTIFYFMWSNIFFNFYWLIVHLQCYVSFRCTAKWSQWHIYSLFFRFVSHIAHYRILSWVPCEIRRSLLVICFILRYHLRHQENPHNSGWGFPGGVSGKEPACQCRSPKRCRFDRWVGKIPWTQTTLAFLPGESHRHRSLVGYSS